MDDKEPLELLTIKEVAAMAKVTTMTVYRWRRQGVLPAPLKIGGRSRWPRHELEQTLLSLPRAA